MKNLIKEFKEFAVKGNMVDIAIGVIIGAAFNKVVEAIVKEVFMPPLSLLTGGITLANKKLILREAIVNDGVTGAEEIAIGYGRLIEVSIDFLIIGITVFAIIKLINIIRNKAEDPADPSITTPKDIELLNEMTELLKTQNKLLEGK